MALVRDDFLMNKRAVFLQSFLLFGLIVYSAAVEASAPNQLERDAYTSWITSIGSKDSPFIEQGFDWWYEERGRELPGEVYQDPAGIYVVVDRALKETTELEDMGEITKGVTYGSEVYDRIDAPIETVLEAILFRWGKPIGKNEGTTFPIDNVYGQRKESLELRWGAGSYWSQEVKTQGGLAKDIRDNYTLLVRGSGNTGYELIGMFHSPFGETSTISSLMMMQLRSVSPGVTEYKAYSRHMGQYYGFLGIEYGRKNFGFNPSRVREGQVEFIRSVMELKETGNIRERLPDFAPFGLN